MSVEQPTSVTADLLYHHDRVRQEARLARIAHCPHAARIHAELMRLHEIRRDGLLALG